MYEFHGWINISSTERDELISEQVRRMQDKLCRDIEEKVQQIEWCNGIFKLYRGINGQDHLVITGCANHINRDIIDFYYWVASKKSDSYGILHILDDDKVSADKRYGIKAFRLVRDEVVEFTDPIMSAEVDRILGIEE